MLEFFLKLKVIAFDLSLSLTRGKIINIFKISDLCNGKSFRSNPFF